MAKPVELVALTCIRCSTPLQANPGEAAWVCAQCGQGMLLGEQGLGPLEVHYSAGIPANARGKPYWVFDGQVQIDRSVYGSSHQQDEAARYWSVPRSFCIPAYECSLDAFILSGRQLLERPPALQDGPPAAFEPVILAADDLLPMAEFIVLSIEAARKDKLKEVQFSVALEPASLWILPA